MPHIHNSTISQFYNFWVAWKSSNDSHFHKHLWCPLDNPNKNSQIPKNWIGFSVYFALQFKQVALSLPIFYSKKAAQFACVFHTFYHFSLSNRFTCFAARDVMCCITNVLTSAQIMIDTYLPGKIIKANQFPSRNCRKRSKWL